MSVEAAVPTSSVRELLRLFRLRDWIKSAFIFLPLPFAWAAGIGVGSSSSTVTPSGRVSTSASAAISCASAEFGALCWNGTPSLIARRTAIGSSGNLAIISPLRLP